ncbi:unnamed protein product [Pieris macdunnoughi]|uniref:Uncharacterized protein n=1 Tax=Pieris macdunnoughi TaxID=345717 RepID=A0A821LYR8_9NEOP|nr:unnamed protein product [Pieris macdunnoughi]
MISCLYKNATVCLVCSWRSIVGNYLTLGRSTVEYERNQCGREEAADQYLVLGASKANAPNTDPGALHRRVDEPYTPACHTP